MKKIIFLFVTVCFAFVLANAQGNKVTNCYTLEHSFYIVCTGELVTGQETICVTTWEGKMQYKNKAVFYGESGSLYEGSIVQNEKIKPYVPGTAMVYSDVLTGSLYKDGVEIGVTKTRVHYTVNANGEVVVERAESEGWECF